MSLREKLIKNSTIDNTATLSDSKIFNKKDVVPTLVPMINVALSGSVDGGITPGHTMLAGPSKHFKTGFMLLMVQAFLKKYPNGAVLFYDSEFGTPESYIDAFSLDKDAIIHSPITDIEQLKFDIMQQLQGVNRGDELMIIIDSIGNLASRKEVDDALEGKSVADMTRAKQMKSLFRMVTPHLTLKNIPLISVNHTYREIGLYPKDIVSGGTGAYYSADNIWVLGRQQDKDQGKELEGYHFVINVEKSRYVREKSKIPITVSFEGGINRWSGLFDAALDGGYIVSGKKGWYNLVDKSTGEVLDPGMRASDIDENGEIWNAMFKDTDFAAYLKNKYQIGGSDLLIEEE